MRDAAVVAERRAERPSVEIADDEGSIPFTRSNKIRHFLQSIFPATPAGKTMGRSVWGELGSGRVGVDKAAQRQLGHVHNIGVAKVTAANNRSRSLGSCGVQLGMSAKCQ